MTLMRARSVYVVAPPVASQIASTVVNLEKRAISNLSESVRLDEEALRFQVSAMLTDSFITTELLVIYVRRTIKCILHVAIKCIIRCLSYAECRIVSENVYGHGASDCACPWVRTINTLSPNLLDSVRSEDPNRCLALSICGPVCPSKMLPSNNRNSLTI